jgi:hypothetical protein
MLTSYLVIIPALLLSHCSKDPQPIVMVRQDDNLVQDALLTLAGGIIYIISGSATINFYKVMVILE